MIVRAQRYVHVVSILNGYVTGRGVMLGAAEHATIRRAWYAVALARDVDRKPSRTWLLGEPIVLFRAQSGEPVALRDICPHRQAPLSMGKVIGDEIQCRYHGFQFNRHGACTKLPGEKIIPKAVQVRVFPVVETLGFIWAWGGDPTNIACNRLPVFPWLENPQFLSHYTSTVVDAPFDLIVDNLMDLTHVHFVHSILGAENMVHDSAPMKNWEEDGRVLYTRDLKKDNGPADRYVEIRGEFIPPSVVVTSGVPRRVGDSEIQPGPMSQVMHCLTPRTPQSTQYLAVKCWNLASRPHEVAAMQHQIEVTIAEDKEIIEAQYQNRSVESAITEETLVRADRAAVSARRAYNRLLEKERADLNSGGKMPVPPAVIS